MLQIRLRDHASCLDFAALNTDRHTGREEMMEVILPLLVILMKLQSQVSSQEIAQCSTGHAAKIQFCVSTRRNKTGHRLVEVKIMNGVDYSTIIDSSNEMTVDVEHYTSLCNNSEVITTWAMAKAPPVKIRSPDYELFPEFGYYKMHTTPQNWNQAKLTCAKERSHLLVVNSEGEAGVVKQFFDRKPNIQGANWGGYVHVGFSDQAVEGQYVTVLGQPLSSSGYIKWMPGEPTNPPGCSETDSDCGLMHSSGVLYVRPCLCKAAFICEQEL